VPARLRLEAVERRIERAGLDPQVLGGLLDVLGDGVAVSRAVEQRAEDEQLERALEELALRVLHDGDRLLNN
jgi:hypothetical protein